jgi:hypothetical protein
MIKYMPLILTIGSTIGNIITHLKNPTSGDKILVEDNGTQIEYKLKL